MEQGRHKGVSAVAPKTRFRRSSARADSVSRRSDLGKCRNGRLAGAARRSWKRQNAFLTPKGAPPLTWAFTYFAPGPTGRELSAVVELLAVPKYDEALADYFAKNGLKMERIAGKD